MQNTNFVREDFTAERTETGYRLTANAPGGVIRAYWSTRPNGFCDDNELGMFRDALGFRDPAGGRRLYFHLVDDNARYSVAAVRLHDIESLPNFRDIGGYNTADGRSFVNYGLLFRSDKLCQLDEAGAKRFRRYHIRQIVDFRVPVEIERGVDPAFPGTAWLNTHPIAADNRCFYMSPDAILSQTEAELEDGRAALFEQYGEMPFRSDAYRTMFHLLKKGKLPLLFHCSAGKDRTGVAAALILYVLGVPTETIVYDYLLTQTARLAEIEEHTALFRDRMDSECIQRCVEMFTSVSEVSIRHTIDAIRTRYGDDVYAYAQHELALSRDDVAELRARCLTEHTISQ